MGNNSGREKRWDPGAGRFQTRLGRANEVEAVADILRRAFAGFRLQYTEGAFRATTPTAEELAMRFSEGPVWLVDLDGLPVGTVAGVPQGAALYVRSMAVLPEVRGGGAGRLLLGALENWARGRGISRLYLSTTPFLEAAIGLYCREGFRRTDRGPHDLYGTALFTMEKILE